MLSYNGTTPSQNIRGNSVPGSIFSNIISFPPVKLKKINTSHGYINNHQSPFIDPLKIELKNFEKLPLLDYGGHEMKYPFNHKKNEFSKKFKSLYFLMV